MNEDIKQRLLDSYDGVVKFIESGADFAKDQAPLVVEEIIRWGLVSSILEIAVGILCAVTVFFCLKRAKKVDWVEPSQSNVSILGGIIVGIIIFLICIITGVPRLCYILCAPRLYVLDYVKTLIQ